MQYNLKWYCNYSKVQYIYIFFIYILYFLLVSCSNKNNNYNKTIFRYNESSGIFTLDPAFAKDQAHTWITNQLFNGLVQLDENLNVKPCIAHKWDISNDGKFYTFYLRKDVFFQHCMDTYKTAFWLC